MKIVIVIGCFCIMGFGQFILKILVWEGFYVILIMCNVQCGEDFFRWVSEEDFGFIVLEYDVI